jgi:transcriptional regulator with XRE-family HTH domain
MSPVAKQGFLKNRRSESMTTIGQRIREIRKSRNLTQRELADRVGINFTYLSRVENDRLDDEQTPREETLQRIAKALEADPDELLLLARRIPDSYRDRILSSPGVFRKLLNLSDADLEDLVGQLEQHARRSRHL